MFCRNCGTELGYKEDPCKKCNYKRGFGVDYCPDCGAETEARARKCPECKATLFVMRNTKPRNRVVATLLAFFIGMFGIHNFYLGYTKKAVAQLLICLLGSCLVVGPLAASVWGLIDGIMILCGKITTDGNGIPMKD